MKTHKQKLIKALRLAFEANRDAHLCRNRAIMESKINFMIKGNPSKEASNKKKILYNQKDRYLRQAIKLIEDYKIDVKYGLRDGILFFKDGGIMLTFHVFKVESKPTDMIWDKKRHKIFPYDNRKGKIIEKK